ncbi:hypothetical protein C8J57DRAFT_1261701 [Mycena rebaudengoi]|nr:hypothetical protein C8J57DRAFT_1261701 [Mycena rebaudengoi]
MDDCDVPVDVIVAHVTSATSAIADNFAVADDGSIMRAGNAEMSDAEEEDAVLPAVLGCGQRKKFGARRYNGPYSTWGQQAAAAAGARASGTAAVIQHRRHVVQLLPGQRTEEKG